MQLNSTDKFLNAITLELPRGSRVLDLGSGSGGKWNANYAKFLGKQGYVVTAVDKEPGVGLPWPGVTYLQKSVEQFLVEYKKFFSLVMLRCVLPFIPRECVNLAAAHLVPGGILYVLTFEPGDGILPDKLLVPKEELQKELKLIGMQEMVSESYTLSDDHPPRGPHTHKMLALVYRKPLIPGGSMDMAIAPAPLVMS